MTGICTLRLIVDLMTEVDRMLHHQTNSMTLQLNRAESGDEVRQSAMPWDLPVGLSGFPREEMKTAHNRMVATKEVGAGVEVEVQARLLAADEAGATFKIVAPTVDAAEEVGVDLVVMETSKEAEAAIIKMATMITMMKAAVDVREASMISPMAAMKSNILPDTITVRTTNTVEVTLLVDAVDVVTLAAEAVAAFIVEDVVGGLLEEVAEATFEAVEEEDAIERLVNLL